MGQLWLCHDKSLDRMVVVKQMQQDIEDSDVNVRRFMQEGNILAHLNHPAITKPYALWKEKDGKLSLSMEFVHGLTLRQILDKVPQPPLWVVLNILHEILCALGEAHRKGIVHRDLKPANIMVDNDGRVHLLDFGIAHTENPLKFNKGEDAERLTQTGAILGTVTYMSPEQTIGEEATPASDLFAIGIIASEMLLGQNLFRGTNFSDTLTRIQKLRVTEKAFSKELPRRLRKLIELHSMPPSKFRKSCETSPATWSLTWPCGFTLLRILSSKRQNLLTKRFILNPRSTPLTESSCYSRVFAWEPWPVL